MNKLNLMKIILIVLIIISTRVNLFSGYFEAGCKYYTYKQYDIARDMFLKEIEIRDNGNAYYFLGEIEKNEDDFDKAEEYFRLSISKRISKKYLKLAYWNLIIIEEQRGKYCEMVVLCKELWDRMKDEGAKKKAEALINKYLRTDNQEAKDLYIQGIEYKRKDMIEDAKNNFYAAIDKDPSFLAAKFEIGLILYEEDNINNAIHYLMNVKDGIPFYGEVNLLLGEIYFNKQLYHHSIAYFDRAIEYGFIGKKTEFLLRLQRGTSFYNIRDYEKAKEEIKKVLEINKYAIEPLLILSAIYIKDGNYNEALKTLQKAENIKPNNHEVIFQIGSIYYKMGDPKYLYHFDRLLERLYSTKTSLPTKYYRAFIILVKDHFKNGRYTKVAKIIESLPESLKDYEINLISAKTYHHLYNSDKAIEYFEKLSLNNDDKYTLCINYARKGMDEKARNILWDLSYIDGYLEKAKLEQNLKNIAYEIENKRIKIEEEERASTKEEVVIDDSVKTKQNIEAEKIEEKAEGEIVEEEINNIEEVENNIEKGYDEIN